MSEPFRVLVGLIGGPPVAIRITPPELEALRAMVDRLSPVIRYEVRTDATHTLRELDVRLGACAALFGDSDGADFAVPMVPDELARLRRVYDATAGGDGLLRAVTGIHDLMRQLDRRVGAAQAAYVNGAAHHPMPRHAGTVAAAVVPPAGV